MPRLSPHWAFCFTFVLLTAPLLWSAERPKTTRSARRRPVQPPIEQPTDGQVDVESSINEPIDDTAPARKPKQKRPPKAAAKEPKAKFDAAKEKSFRQVQRSVLQQMKSKDPGVRTAAVERLADYPTPDAARLLVEQGLASGYDDVRQASYETLLGFKDHEEVTQSMLASVAKDIKRGPSRGATGTMLSVALASDTAATQDRAFELLDAAVKQPKGGLLLVVSLADALGAEASDTSLATLVKISQRPIFDEQFAVRRSAVQAMTKIRTVEAVDALVKLLANVKGEVRGDIVRHLTAISGERFGLDAAAWDEWWKTNKDQFDFPGAAEQAANRAEPVRSMASYYGMPIYAARLVFVLDTSRSMLRDGRIWAAKRELTSAINGLPEGVYFSVLAFNSQVVSWRRELAIASAENKRQAVAFVERQDVGHSTASYDALETAFDFDTESIFFLTDGAPHGGKVEQPEEIVEVVTRLNHTRRVTINAIGVSVGPPGPANPFDTFLKTLSEQNYGEYRRVDQ